MKTLFDFDITLEEAEKLIESGVDVNVVDEYGFTPLYFIDNIQIATLLISHGANINHCNQYNETPLFSAQSYELSKVLIKNGAIINIRNDLGSTPLMIAPNIDIANLLIENGAVPSKVIKYKKIRHLFSEEQQKAFDAFVSITNNDNDFFHMCLAYENDQKNNVNMNIKDMDLL